VTGAGVPRLQATGGPGDRLRRNGVGHGRVARPHHDHRTHPRRSCRPAR